MIIKRSDTKLGRARSMRRLSTKAEDMLWRDLRDRGIGIKFRRQVPIGPYIADFACLASKLVIELDGPPHLRLEQQESDQRRDTWFRSHGWHVLRVSNEVVFGGSNVVLDQIKSALYRAPSSDLASRGHLLPQAGEGREEKNV